MKGIGARCIAVLLIASIAGCGAVPEQPEKTKVPYRLPSGAKVALIEGQFVKELFDQGLSIKRRHSQGADGPLIQNPVGGAVVGAGGGAVYGALYGFTCGPLVIVCAPLFAVTGAVVGGVAGAVKGAQNAERYSKNVDEEAAAQLAAEKATTEKPALEHEATMEKLAAISESRGSLRPFLERVQRYARDSSIGEPSELPKQTPQSETDKSRYHGEADYVFEIAVTGPEPNYMNTYWFKFSAQGRLIRTSDNSVVSTYDTNAYTHEYTFNEWKEDNATRITTELDSALDDLAKQFADGWIKPLLQGHAELYILKDIESTPEQTTGVVKRTDERPAGVDSGPFIGVPIPEFRKPSKDAAAATKGVAKGTNESPSEKPIRKDVEQKPTPSDSPFPSPTNPQHEWMRSTSPR